MEVVSLQPPPTPSPTLLFHDNYTTVLKESIHRFLSQPQTGISNLSSFNAIFFRLLQARVDPPLETIWFYSAARYRTADIEVEETGIVRVKDLFQLLTACSASCNGLKSVAVLCPVLPELVKLSVEGGKKVLKEVECLVEGILGYIGICGGEDYGRDDFLEELVSSFGELVRAWKGEENGDFEIREGLRVFFPLVSDEIREGFSSGEFTVGYLVGVAIVQAFLLRLCLKLKDGAGLSKVALKQELTTWAVSSITMFGNCCFFELLLRLLLDSTLPVTSLLDSKDEAFLREVLLDAVVLVEYSFLNRPLMLTSKWVNRLALRRLIIVHEASQDAREKRDHPKAISYINAFSRSCLPSKLVEWGTSLIGMDEETSKPNVTTPQALLKWLLTFERQGVRFFDDNTLKLRAKSALDESKSGYEHRVLHPKSNVEDDLLFYIDNKREGEEEKADDQEMFDSTDAAFKAAVHTMKFTANDKRRKRKEQKGEEKTKVKYHKYNLNDSSVKEKILPSKAHDDVTSSDSEMEDPVSDESMDE